MNGATYTLREIAGELNLPESTIRYYRDAFASHIPTVGLGRRRRYPTEAIEVFRVITEGYAHSLSREEIEVRVQQVAPPVTSTPEVTQTTALRLHRQAPIASQSTEALMATMMDGERERRDVMWQMTRELVRMGEVLDRQAMALVQITQHLEWGGNRALPPGQGVAPVPYTGGVVPAAPVRDEAALAKELHALREELQRERELVERLRRSKLEIERRATSAEAELQHRAESPDMGALRKFLSKDRG